MPSSVIEIDQKYFSLCRIFRVLGTPTEKTWPGVSSLPDYKSVFPKWEAPLDRRQILPVDLSSGGHHLLSQLLTYNPDKRISSRQALKHPYMSNVISVIPPTC